VILEKTKVSLEEVGISVPDAPQKEHYVDNERLSRELAEWKLEFVRCKEARTA
jgi:hypothetical protein